MVHNCFTDRDFIYKFEEYSIKIIYKIIEKGKFYLWFSLPPYITNTARENLYMILLVGYSNVLRNLDFKMCFLLLFIFCWIRYEYLL